MKEKFKIYGSIFLLAIFMWHLCNITLFPHTHNVGGVIICHSHPFSGTTDNPDHTHTSAELATIAQLSILLMLVAAVFFFIFLLRQKKKVLLPPPAVAVTGGETLHFYLRGPPIF